MDELTEVVNDMALDGAWYNVHEMEKTLHEMYGNTNLLESMQKCKSLIGQLESLIHAYMNWTQCYEIEHGEKTEVTAAYQELFKEAADRFGRPSLD